MSTSGIYKMTFPSGKTYVGQSWNIEKRWYLYSRKTTGSPKLKRALEKYEFNDVILEVIEEVNSDQTEMDEKEIFWIKELDSIDSGYNLMAGGRGGKHTQESIQKMREANEGIRRSPDTEFKKGHSLTDKKEEIRSKSISKAKKGKPLSETHKKALRKPKNLSEKARQENKNRCKGKTWKLIDGKRVWLERDNK